MRTDRIPAASRAILLGKTSFPFLKKRKHSRRGHRDRGLLNVFQERIRFEERRRKGPEFRAARNSRDWLCCPTYHGRSQRMCRWRLPREQRKRETRRAPPAAGSPGQRGFGERTMRSLDRSNGCDAYGKGAWTHVWQRHRMRRPRRPQHTGPAQPLRRSRRERPEPRLAPWPQSSTPPSPLRYGQYLLTSTGCYFSNFRSRSGVTP